MLRAKRNCSSAGTYTVECNNMVTRFRQRGYPNWVLKKAVEVVSSKERDSILYQQPRVLSEDIGDEVRFVTTFDT